MCVGELRSAYTFLFGKSDEKRALGKPGIVKQMCVRKWIAFIWLRTGSSKGKKVKQYRYTPWRRLGGEEV
jgi:hypothetical protein